MSKYTKEDIFKIVEEEDVEFIRLQFTDIFGTLKNVAITSSQLEKALNNKCMFDGSSIEGFVRIEESDMYLYPDLDTFTIFPWRPQQGKVARIICDIYCADKTPFTGDSRYILKRQIEEAKNLGYTFNVGPECEFFLFHQDENGQPTTLSHEKAGYFDLGPVDLGENARRDMVLTLEDMGYEIEASHHEVAPAQHEIDFKYDEALLRKELIVNSYLHSHTIQILQTAPRVFQLMEPILEKNGIPEDFKYLAVIESRLNPQAQSPAGAVGVWQFLKGTGKENGLEINNEVDERYHIEK